MAHEVGCACPPCSFLRILGMPDEAIAAAAKRAEDELARVALAEARREKSFMVRGYDIPFGKRWWKAFVMEGLKPPEGVRTAYFGVIGLVNKN